MPILTDTYEYKELVIPNSKRIFYLNKYGKLGWKLNYIDNQQVNSYVLLERVGGIIQLTPDK